jgi:hypothetical protein
MTQKLGAIMKKEKLFLLFSFTAPYAAYGH